MEEGRYDEAARIIENYSERAYKEKDLVLYYLDTGMLYHFSGEYEKSNHALEQAERKIEELYTESLTKGVASFILNDNASDYEGEDYEDVYLNIFKAINYLRLGKYDSAMVELRRIHIKLNLLEDRYKKEVAAYKDSEEGGGQIEAVDNPFHNDALARYLGMLLYRYQGDRDGTRIEREFFQQAFLSQKGLYDFLPPPLPDAELSREKAHLSILAFTGRSPTKLEETLRLQTVEDGVWITMSGQGEDYVNALMGFRYLFMPGVPAGYQFRLSYPRMKLLGSRIDRILIRANGEILGELPLLEDMEKIAYATFLAKQPLVMVRAIARVVSKGIAKELAVEAAFSHSDEMGLLAWLSLNIGTELSEGADLRVGRYFPARAYGMDYTLPPGEYNIVLEYYQGSRLLFRDERGAYNLELGKLNLLTSYSAQ